MSYEVVLIILLITRAGICATPTIEYTSSFPIHANSTFQLIFSAMTEYKYLSIIRVEMLQENEVVAKTLIYPGIADQIEDKVFNQYFWLENWFKDTYGRIHLNLRLLEMANNKWLCVSFKEPRSISDKNNVLREPCSKNALFYTQIQLTVDPTLNLKISTKDGRSDGVHHNDIAIITCISRKGVPPYAPSLSHPSSLIVKSRQYIKETNTFMLYFLASIVDHGKIVTCTAGRSSVSTTINVFHNPTAVHLRPSYSIYLSNGSSVECISSNGFPEPTVIWIFVKGPPNASKYYQISSNNNLTIFPNAPIGSHWEFNCSSINSITASYDAGVTKTFKFIIYPIDKRKMVILTVLICGGAVILVAIVIICNRRRIQKKMMAFINSRSGANKEAGDDTLNNLSSSYFTYPTVQESTDDSGLEPESKKSIRKSRRNKAKRDSDIYEEDNIV